MKLKKQRHVVDFLFPLALFVLFAVCALLVILYAARSYGNVVDSSSLNTSARTATSYVTEKLHQNDANGGISKGKLDGLDALLLKQDVNGKEYVTYIYYYDGYLSELYAPESANLSASAGTKILEIKDFKIEELSEGSLFEISCTDENGDIDTQLVSVKSTNSGKEER